MTKERRPRTAQAPRFTVEVTREMIEEAIPRHSGYCMFAEGVKAAYPRAVRVSVDLQTIRFTDPERSYRYTYLTPRTVQVALVQFDQEIKPEPLRFQLRSGQVSAAGSRAPKYRKKLTDEERARLKKHGADMLERTRLVVRDGQERNVPDRVGGKPPPIGFGARRAFGLRALER